MWAREDTRTARQRGRARSYAGNSRGVGKLLLAEHARENDESTYHESSRHECTMSIVLFPGDRYDAACRVTSSACDFSAGSSICCPGASAELSFPQPGV